MIQSPCSGPRGGRVWAHSGGTSGGLVECESAQTVWSGTVPLWMGTGLDPSKSLPTAAMGCPRARTESPRGVMVADWLLERLSPMAYADPSHLFFSPDDWGEIFFRIGLAVLAGGAVGINRDRVKRPAGLRTYMTVSVGSAFFVMLILQAGVDFNATNALSRTVQGITTGVGFIGAGLIFQQQSEHSSAPIKGLTSAAALWLTASLGTAAGCGLCRLSRRGVIPPRCPEA